MFLGITAGCIYGMVEVNAQLIDEGLSTVASVQNYIAQVMGVLDDGIDAGNSIDLALYGISSIIEDTVNVTDITSQLECIRPLLDSLPDPNSLQTEVQKIDDGIGTLLPLLQTVSDSVQALSSVDGSSGAIPALANAKTGIELLQTQMQAFYTTTDALTVPIATPGTVEATREALATLLSTPTSYASKLQALNTTILALQTIETSIIDSDDALSALLLASTSLLQGPALTGLNGTLANMTALYSTTRPCMVNMQARAMLINTTAFELPVPVETAMTTLVQAQAGLDALLGVPTSSNETTASEQLTQALGQAAGEIAYLQQMSSEVSGARQQLVTSGAITTLTGSLQTIYTGMSSAQTQLETLLGQTNAYLQAPNPLVYLVLGSNLKGAGGSATSGATALGQWLASADPVYTEAQYIQTEIETSDPGSQVNALATQLQSLPVGTAIQVPLAAYQLQYLSLPQPPSTLINPMIYSVVYIVNNVEDTVVSARSVLGDAIATATSTTVTVREKVTDQIDAKVAQYEPTARYYDIIRQAAMYSLFSVALFMAIVLLLGAALLWPAALKLGTFLTLVLYTIEFAIVVALTAGLKVGSDGCTNLESQVLQHLATSPSAANIAKYYFFNQGSTPKQILNDAFQLDIDAGLDQVIAARDQMQNRTSEYGVTGSLANAISQAVNGSQAIESSVNDLLYVIDYHQVNALYVDVKQYPCCTVMDVGGGVWTGLIIAGCFAFVQCITAMVLIGRFDELDLTGCCRWYAGKSGREALMVGDTTAFIDTAQLENGTGSVPTSIPTSTSPPRQSRIFKLFSPRSFPPQDPTPTEISIVADGRAPPATTNTINTTIKSSSSSWWQRRESSAPPPPPSAPPFSPSPS